MRQFEGYKKGVDLGGWLSQCGAENYNDGHYSSFIHEEDIAKIASWGMDHVRLPVDYNVVQNEDGSFIESGFGYIDNCIDWCGKNNLKIVLDLHKCLGYVFDDKEYCDFFKSEELQKIFIKLWEEFTRRYGKYRDRVSFELLNEITDPGTAQTWNRIAADTVKAIRAIDKDVQIIIGGIFNSSIYGLTLLDPPADENIVFTFHCYNPLIFTHQTAQWVEKMPKEMEVKYPAKLSEYKELSAPIWGSDFDHELSYGADVIDSVFFEKLFAEAVEISEKYNVPLYCGEYGVIDRADTESTLNWFRDIHAAFEKFDIARAVWSYKKMDFGLTDEHYAPVIDEIIKVL